MMVKGEKWWWVSGRSALACTGRRMSCGFDLFSRPFASPSSSRVPLRRAEADRLFALLSNGTQDLAKTAMQRNGLRAQGRRRRREDGLPSAGCWMYAVSRKSDGEGGHRTRTLLAPSGPSPTSSKSRAERCNPVSHVSTSPIARLRPRSP